jgi:hypothetical protein
MFEPMHAEFAAALLDAQRPVPAGITSHTSTAPARRFAVYRNNVVAGLVKVLAVRFPAVEKIVGEEFFAAMARLFVAANPPRSPLLMYYGSEFPAFIARFPPAAELPYLADVARLELARARAYHAADAKPVDPKALQAVDPAAVGDLRLRLHPSVEVVRSAHPIVTIWAMNAGEAELGEVKDWHAEDALVVRPLLAVEVRLLPPGGAAFLRSLRSGARLGRAAESALVEDQRFDLAANLAGLIGSGLVTGVRGMEPREGRDS